MSRKWLWIPPALALAFLFGALALFAAEPDPRPAGDESSAPQSLPSSAAQRASPLPPPVFGSAPAPAFGGPTPIPRLPPRVLPPSAPQAPQPGPYPAAVPAPPPPPEDDREPAEGGRPRGPGYRPRPTMRGGGPMAEPVEE